MIKELFIPELDTIERFAGRYALGFERGEGSYHFLRIKIVAGELNTDQAKVIAELSKKYSKNYLEITTRHDIQLHWIKDEDAFEIFPKLEKLGLTTDMCGQAYPGARYGDVRNIVTCPLSGVQKGELIDVLPIVREAANFFTGKEEYLDLPRKFKIAISSCPLNCVRLDINDVGLKTVESEYGIGFTAFIGGGIGHPPILAKPANIFIPPEDLLSFLKAIVEVYNEHGNRESKVKARFKWLVESLGLEKVKEMIEQKMGKKLKKFDASKVHLTFRDHIGYNVQKQNHLLYLVIPIPSGILTSEKFLRIADIAEKYCEGRFRLSTSQNVVLINIPAGKLNRVREEIEQLGFSLNPIPIRWTTTACPTNFCGKGAENIKERAIEVEKHLERIFGDKLKDLFIKIAYSGCPNSCTGYNIADIGLLSVKIKQGEKSIPAYNIYLKGKSPISKLFAKGIPAGEVKFTIQEIINDYLKSKQKFSSFQEFAEFMLEEKAKS